MNGLSTTDKFSFKYILQDRMGSLSLMMEDMKSYIKMARVQVERVILRE